MTLSIIPKSIFREGLEDRLFEIFEELILVIPEIDRLFVNLHFIRSGNGYYPGLSVKSCYMTVVEFINPETLNASPRHAEFHFLPAAMMGEDFAKWLAEQQHIKNPDGSYPEYFEVPFDKLKGIESFSAYTNTNYWLFRFLRKKSEKTGREKVVGAVSISAAQKLDFEQYKNEFLFFLKFIAEIAESFFANEKDTNNSVKIIFSNNQIHGNMDFKANRDINFNHSTINEYRASVVQHMNEQNIFSEMDSKILDAIAASEAEPEKKREAMQLVSAMREPKPEPEKQSYRDRFVSFLKDNKQILQQIAGLGIGAVCGHFGIMGADALFES